jgi:hypothetical protein
VDLGAQNAADVGFTPGSVDVFRNVGKWNYILAPDSMDPSGPADEIVNLIFLC